MAWERRRRAGVVTGRPVALRAGLTGKALVAEADG